MSEEVIPMRPPCLCKTVMFISAVGENGDKFWKCDRCKDDIVYKVMLERYSFSVLKRDGKI